MATRHDPRRRPQLPRSWLSALAFTAGLVRELVAMLASSPGRWRDDHSGPSDPVLPRRIFGYTKREVLRLLGPPPTAAMRLAEPSPQTSTAATTFWQANTWYYPVDPRRQQAVAVQFQADRVVRVDVLVVRST